MFFLVIGRYDKIGRDRLVEWLAALPKPCGVLARTRKTIKAVTFESGFGSVSRLKAIFRERYGMTMREWRNLHRK